MKEKLKELTSKKHGLVAKLVEPARAAANQMKDAGMHKGADPLLTLLFEIDACDQELMEAFWSNPTESIEALISLMTGDKK